MFKLTSNVLGIFRDEKQYLTLVAGGLLLLPLAYLGYLSISAYVLNESMGTLLNNSSVESINLIANLTSLYSAYVILKFRNNLDKRKGFVAFTLIFITQLFLMNQIMIAALLYYVFHFIGIKKLRSYYSSLQRSKNTSIILCSLLAVFISGIILILKLRIGMI